MTHKTLFPFNMSPGKIHLQTWKYLKIVFIEVKFAWFKSFHHCYMISNVEHLQPHTICFMMRPDIQTCFVFNYLPPRVRCMGPGRCVVRRADWNFSPIDILILSWLASTQQKLNPIRDSFCIEGAYLYPAPAVRILVPYLACTMLQRSRRTA